MSSPSLSTFLKLSTLALTLAAFGAGCAATTDNDDEDSGDEVSAEEALRASPIKPGSWKLYGTPRFVPNAGCDVHTSLTLSATGGARANLREVVGGFCEIYVEPQARQYRLRFDHASCGSKIYQGKKRINGKMRQITITDHRSRICRDLVPAKIIVEETDAAGATQTKFSFDGQPPAPAPTSTWLTIAPKQCGSNPWSGAQPVAGQDPSYLQAEAGEVDNFFRGKGIKLDQVGFAHPAEAMMVCMACSCPRGDTLIVHAATTADAQKLVAQYGFAAMPDALTTSPKQCGTNPWEAGQQTQSNADESRQLSSWAATSGAPLEAAGFVDFTEPRMVCMACSCPRGDVAVAFPQNATTASKLENLGWMRVEN